MNPSATKPKNKYTNIYPNIDSINKEIAQINQIDAQQKEQNLTSIKKQNTASNYRRKEARKENLYAPEQSPYTKYDPLGIQEITTITTITTQNDLNKDSPSKANQTLKLSTMNISTEASASQKTTTKTDIIEKKVDNDINKSSLYKKVDKILNIYGPMGACLWHNHHFEKKLHRLHKFNTQTIYLIKSISELFSYQKKYTYQNLLYIIKDQHKTNHTIPQETLAKYKIELNNATIALRNVYIYQIKFIKKIIKYFKPMNSVVISLLEQFSKHIFLLDSLITQIDPEILNSIKKQPQSQEYKTNVVTTNKAILDLINIVTFIKTMNFTPNEQNEEMLLTGFADQITEKLHNFFTKHHSKQLQHDQKLESRGSLCANLLLKYYFTSKIREKFKGLFDASVDSKERQQTLEIMQVTKKACKTIKSQLLQHVNNKDDLIHEATHYLKDNELPNGKEACDQTSMNSKNLSQRIHETIEEVFKEKISPNTMVNASNSTSLTAHPENTINL